MTPYDRVVATIMKRDGANWVGKSPFGSPVTFKRGDW